MSIKLETTDSERHELLATTEGLRKGATMCRVSKVALQHLLNDHDTLCQAARAAKLPFRVGIDQRSLEPF